MTQRAQTEGGGTAGHEGVRGLGEKKIALANEYSDSEDESEDDA